MTVWRIVCTAVAAPSTSVGCGVTTSNNVEIADVEDVPFGLLEPDRVPTALRPVNGAVVVHLYLFDPDSSALVPVTRRIAADSIEAVVAELDTGPTESETFLGLRSALSDIDAIDGVNVDGSTAFVNLNDSFTTLGGGDQTIAIDSCSQ